MVALFELSETGGAPHAFSGAQGKLLTAVEEPGNDKQSHQRCQKEQAGKGERWVKKWDN